MWRRVGRHSMIFWAGGLVMAGLQTVYRLVAIGELSVSHYGQVALLISIFNAVLLAGQAGIPVAAARLTARVDKAPDTTIVSASLRAAAIPCVIASVGMAGVTYAILGSWAGALLALVGMPPMVLSAVFAGFLQGKGRVVAAASVQPVNTVAQLAALGALVVTSVDIGPGMIMTTFYVGNVAALVFGGVFLLRNWDRTPAPAGPVSDEVRPGRILTFSVFLTLSTLAAFLLPVLSRVGVAHESYEQVAFFDLALLLYTVPERLAASIVNALIPIASAAQSARERVTVPATADVAIVTVAVALGSFALWETHAVRELLEAVGLGHYVDAEALLVIILVAAPAELLFMVNAGLLSAFGETKRLAALSGAVFAVSLVLLVPASVLGAHWVAGLLVIDFWALYFATNAILPADSVRRRRLWGRALGVLRTKDVAAGAAATTTRR